MIHPVYVPDASLNDIALVELAGEVSFNDRARPICLPKGGINFRPGTMCTATGFGSIKNGGPPSKTLMKTELPIVDDKKCAALFGPQVKEHSFCAGFEEDKKTSTCHGDSGGPLACQKDGQYYLVGAVSHGIPCAVPGFPDVFTNVTFFVEWIEKWMKLLG